MNLMMDLKRPIRQVARRWFDGFNRLTNRPMADEWRGFIIEINSIERQFRFKVAGSL